MVTFLVLLGKEVDEVRKRLFCCYAVRRGICCYYVRCWLLFQDGEDYDDEDDDGEGSDAEPPSDVPDEEKTPVTVVTGFLGAGKTTLVNYILKEQVNNARCGLRRLRLSDMLLHFFPFA